MVRDNVYVFDLSDMDNAKFVQNEGAYETFYIDQEKPSLLKIDHQKDLLKMVDPNSLEEK